MSENKFGRDKRNKRDKRNERDKIKQIYLGV
jgi:hypothetical protein